jgi:hypothetical protein
MSGFLLVLAMGLVSWYAWPATLNSFPAKVWTIFFAVFLAPFSWPWLVARGFRARRHRAALRAIGRAAAEGFRSGAASAKADKLHRDSVTWWQDEWRAADTAGDSERRRLAAEVLEAMHAPNPGQRRDV